MPDAGVIEKLSAIVGPARVLVRGGELLTYESDGLPTYHRRPSLAVFPGSRQEVIEVVRLLAQHNLPFVPRGSGTGLSGGALADDVILLGLHRLRQIISIDPENCLAVVEPGVVNSTLTRAVTPYGLHYAPDPSSQTACTIGGNVAENAGGPHCLKYGVTTNHVVSITALLPDGSIHTLGDPSGTDGGFDLAGTFVGSEGCFGIALDVTVRLTKNPEAIRTILADFESIDAAAKTVSAIVATGILPAALEMMDKPTIVAVESSIYAAGYPIDAAAILLIEVDGALDGLDDDAQLVTRLCKEHGARSARVAADPADRARLWLGRKKAFGAMGRISPHLVIQDAVVPRTQLPAVMDQIHQIATRLNVKVCNVFHAGDGNLHPNIGYDANDPDETARVHEAMGEIMRVCVAAGGSITGEHGVGIDKLDYMSLIFSDESLDAMCALRSVFDPHRRSNPGKAVPVHACREWYGSANVH